MLNVNFQSFVVEEESKSLFPNTTWIHAQVSLTSPRSRKTTVKPVEKEDYETIVKALFPSTPIESLRGLSRDALLEHAKHEGSNHTLETINDSSSAASPAHAITPASLPGMEGNSQLQKFEHQGSTVFEWDEATACQWSGQDDSDMDSYMHMQSMQSAFEGMQPMQYSSAQSNLLLDSIFSNSYTPHNYPFR